MKVIEGTAKSRAVAWWLVIGVIMIMVQVLLGGITRLTGSGLSITEWKPILGALPPMNEADWKLAFEKYKEIGQYKQLNFYFTLEDFKFIYFWEWFHRVWARLIGIVFIIPFIYFLIKGKFRRNMVVPLLVLFLLGGLQGAIGWIMVKSGLNEENLYVSHFRLAIHFMTALGLLAYTVWFALQLLIPDAAKVQQPSQRKWALGIVALLLVQLVYGAFMAGLKAAVTAPTWPTINGVWVPDSFGSSYFSDPLTIQFIHRGLAYLLAVATLGWYVVGYKDKGTGLYARFRPLPLAITIAQVVLGILTVVYSPDQKALLWLGVAHQFTAMLLITSWVTLLYFYSRKNLVLVS